MEKKYLKYRNLIIIIIIFSIIKLVMTCNLPILALPSQGYDDEIMYKLMFELVNGNWLGDYTSLTLIKGCFFPLYLAIIKYLGMSYMHVTTLAYIFSCIYFVYAIRNIFKNKNFLIPIFIVLLFNPISYASWTYQRIYRNGIVSFLELFIFGSIFLLYMNRKEKITKILPHAIIAGISLSALLQTKEDGMWILPYVYVAIIVTIITLIIENRKKIKENIINIVTKSAIFIIPICIVFLVDVLIGYMNYSKYGIFISNEKSKGYIDKCIHAINSVKVEDDIDYVSASRKKIKKIYEISPTLKGIEKDLEERLTEWNSIDRYPSDGEVEDGFFFWALREAVERNDYYKDAKTSNEFYKNVYTEITEAISTGKVESNRCVLGVVWHKKYIKEIVTNINTILKYVVNYEKVISTTEISDSSMGENRIRDVESFTNDTAIYPTDTADTQRFYAKYVSRLNKIGDIYRKTNIYVIIISLICYLGLIAKLITKKEKCLDICLILTGMLFSFFLVVGGVAFINMTSCYAIYYMYLVACYPLMSAFEFISICGFANSFIKKER